jgi:5'-3' exonuclease
MLKGKHASIKRLTLKKPKNPKMLKKLALALMITLMATALYVTQVAHHTQAYKDQVKLQQTYHQLQESKKTIEKTQAESQATTAEKQKQIEELNKKLEETQKQLEAKRNTATAYAAEAPVTHVQPISDDSDAKSFIYSHESGNRPEAVNSIGCRGLGQACPGTKLPCGDDYACQDAYFTSYMLGRYGTWENAKAFWLANHWW